MLVNKRLFHRPTILLRKVPVSELYTCVCVCVLVFPQQNSFSFTDKIFMLLTSNPVIPPTQKCTMSKTRENSFSLQQQSPGFARLGPI